mgnify:CR=1 FL=1
MDEDLTNANDLNQFANQVTRANDKYLGDWNIQQSNPLINRAVLRVFIEY